MHISDQRGSHVTIANNVERRGHHACLRHRRVSTDPGRISESCIAAIILVVRDAVEPRVA
jgi:hypothetical protein